MNVKTFASVWQCAGRKHRIYTQMLGRVMLGCLLLQASVAVADVGIGIFVDKQFYTAGQEVPRLSVSAFNNGGPTTVDVHVVLIAPNSTIYEFTDWNTALQPWFSALPLQGNFTLPATPIGDASGLPGGLTPGIWYAGAALAAPGTLNILALDLVPFNVVQQSPGGSKFGVLALSREATPEGTEVRADAIFYASTGDLGTLVEGVEGVQPGLDQCVFSEFNVDFSGIPQLPNIQTLNAGQPITVQSSPANSLALVPNAEAADFGFTVYEPRDGAPPAGFYQGGARYSFQGPGSAQLGSFSVSMVAPLPLNLVQPPLSLSATHNAAQNLELRWNGNNGVGEVYVSLSGFSGNTDYDIECRFVDDGAGTVPASLLTRLRDSLSDDSGLPIPPGLLPEGFDPSALPPGFDLSDLSDLFGFGTEVDLNVQRVRFAPFNTSRGDLTHGIAVIESGAFMGLTLE